jgi:hypothetical protein
MAIYDKASLVLIPSGTKTSKVYSQVPTNGDGDFTFTRSSAATRVNADGFIEKETQNLFRYSEEFNQGSAWSKQGGAQISPNASTAPDGTNTADLLYPAITGVVKAAIQSFTSGNGTPYAQSIYVKASGKNFAALYAINGSGGAAMWVNLTTGEITNGSIPTAFGQFATSVGNGWWRIGFTDIGNGGISYMHIYPTDVAGSQNVTANGTDGILIWGAQLEYGLVARDYIKTTTTAVEGGITDNVPRLDYTDSSCPALLLEPQRTNLITNSEALSIGTSGSTTEQNTADTTSPEGYYNATKILGSTSYLAKGVGSAFSGNNTTSVFLKHFNDSEIGVYMYDGAYYRVTFNIVNGTISSTFGGATGTITDYGNGWYRCSVSKSTPANVVEVGVDGLSGIVYTYGWQHEYNASYATSYIPTYGSSVTRTHEGTFAIGSMQSKGLVSGAFSFMIDFKDIARGAASGNFIYCYTSTGGTMFYVYAGSIGVHTPTGEQYLTFPEADGKFALVYDGTNVKFFKNGAKYASTYIASTRWADMDDLRLYLSGSTAKINYNETLFFNTALTDQEAIDLTTI